MRSIINSAEAEDLNEGVVLGLDIGGTKTALLAWDCATQTVLTQDAFTTPTETGPEAVIDRLVEASERLLTGCARSLGDLRAIGVAVPGLVDAAAGRVLTAGNLDGWVDLPLADRLGARCAFPVAIEHDANAAALGERWRGAAQDLASFAFVALGTGIGVGLVLNGQLYRGAHHAAGELGDLVVGRQFLGQDRGCQGNLAHLIGGKSLRRRARQATGADLSAAEAITYAEEDAALAVMADEVTDYLAMAIIAIAALLDPQAIIVGGGTAEAGEDLLDPVRERVAREVAAPPLLIASALGSDAQLLGAVCIALQARSPIPVSGTGIPVAFQAAEDSASLAPTARVRVGSLHPTDTYGRAGPRPRGTGRPRTGGMPLPHTAEETGS